MLIIAEKPQAGETIAKALLPNGGIKKDGYIEGNNCFITWGIGHLIGLAPPEIYDPKYKTWNLNDLPIIPDPFILIADPSKKKQLKIIRNLADETNVIVNACDAGAEGQHIFQLIYNHLKLLHPVRRLWTSSLTESAIKKAFQNLKNNQDYDNLHQSAKVRSESDWLIGMNGTRGLTTKFQGELLSVGRVQIPTTAFIYDRTIAIENHQKQKFYEVVATFTQGDTEYKGKWVGEELKAQSLADQITQKVLSKVGKITSYQSGDKNESAPKLHDLTLLQREANNQLGWTAQKTLDVAQGLYDKGFITYPRTNCNYVSEDVIPMMLEVFKQITQRMKAPFFIYAKEELVNEKNKRICRPEKITDHHAIIPTEKLPKGISDDERNLYLIITKRLLAQFFSPARYTVHELTTTVEGENFQTRIKELKDLGWKVVYNNQKNEDEEDDNDDVPSFSINEQQAVICLNSETLDKETQPPKPYTESTLLAAMETCGKSLDDDDLKDALKESGIGTVATRASIIERIKKVGYIDLKGKNILITDKGRKLIELLRQMGLTTLTSPELTGQWELRLNKIAKGLDNPDAFLKSMISYSQMMVKDIQNSTIQVQFKEVTGLKCPNCGSDLTDSKKAYNCTNEIDKECKFTLWKNKYSGKAISDKQIEKLLVTGETDYLKFKSKGGKPYEAKIKLKNKETGETEFTFKEKKALPPSNATNKEIETCPKCQKAKVVDKGTLYGCSAYPTCDFHLPKTLLSRAITEEDAINLIKFRNTDELSGFISKRKKPFSAKLTLNDQLKLEFLFLQKSK